MKSLYSLVLIASLAGAFTSMAQTDDQEIDIEALSEALFSQQEDVAYEEIYENLLQLYLSPIDINRANADELQSLYLLSPLQVSSLMDYRSKFGPFISLYELQAVPHLDLATLKRLLPFITLNHSGTNRSQPLLNRILTEKSLYFMARTRRFMEERKGFTAPDTLGNGRLTSRYKGDPNDLYLRFRSQHSKDFSVGFTLDKDAGEEFTWDPSSRRYGFNFLSYHFTLYDKGNWRTITLGDYQVQFGQGLVFGSGFSVGKGAETITATRRSSIGIGPYTSTMEFGYFRGVAATYARGNFQGTLLYSNAPRDGNLQENSDGEIQNDFFSSLPSSGYHRTPSEISNKATAREQNMGFNIAYQAPHKSFQWGLNTLFTRYNLDYIREDRIYNTFEFRGKTNHIYSGYFSLNHQNHFIFGEIAQSRSGGKGAIAGIMSSLSPHIDLSLLWRNFDRDFHSFYGNAFSEGSRPINERGTYLGISINPSKKIKWNAYYDHFRFPWLKYRTYAPSSGHEWLQRITFSPHKKLSFYFQVREEVKDRNTSISLESPSGYQLATGKRRNYLFNLDFALNETYSMRSRVQQGSFIFDEYRSDGYVLLHDIEAKWDKWKMAGRMALFDTDDYETRQYVYEKNVLWAFSIPSYYGQGMRYYFLLQFQPRRKLTCWLRWAQTTYTDRETIGSGLQKIPGNTISDVTFQLRYQPNR